MSEREPGWYWVRNLGGDDWEPAEWLSIHKWLFIGDEHAQRANPYEIGPRILPPDAQPAPDRWQPIETAPRDGTDILLARDADTFVVLAGWDDDGSGYHWIAPEGCRYSATAFDRWAAVPPYERALAAPAQPQDGRTGK